MPADTDCVLIVDGGEVLFTQPLHHVLDIVVRDGLVLVPSEAYRTQLTVVRGFNMSKGLWKFPEVR